MGRTPKPTALRLLEGNPGKRPINESEPTYIVGIGAPPTWLDSRARKIWVALSVDLDAAGVTTKADRHSFAGLCRAISNMHVASEAAERDGHYIRGSHGGLVVNPAVNDEAKWSMIAAKYYAEFGITPASRSKIKATPKPAGNAFADL